MPLQTPAAKQAKRRYYESNRQRALARSRKWAKNNPESRRATYYKYKEKNKAKIRERGRKWVRANPHVAANRRATERHAMPGWVDRDEIKAIYRDAANQGLVVDHIVPLIHPLVCGLHVPWNLQLLADSDNARKGNAFN